MVRKTLKSFVTALLCGVRAGMTEKGSLAKFHHTQDFDRKIPFLHHELFHVYHRAYFKEGETLMDGLWAEGLAVIAAQTLNPKAEMDQLSLDNPKGLLKDCQKLRKQLVTDLTARLKNPSPSDYSLYFYGSSTHPWIPKRAGYCMGYEIVKTALNCLQCSVQHFSQTIPL